MIAGAPAFTLTIHGSGFVAGSTVELSGTALSHFLGATELTAQVTAGQVAAVGQLRIAVSNPSGALSKAQTLTAVGTPAITSLDPGAVTAGSTAFPLVVRGSGFVSGSVVELNGTALRTAFVDSTHLEAHVPRSGYTTGNDGTFVLFFHNLRGRGETVNLIVSHPSHRNAKSVNAAVKRGATASVNIDMSS